jgi:hypothetical protein
MKKTIRPPENWQDFETLCKKLFGEIWGCPYTIKKNGRLGQPQSGVDVYGKPKGETDHWGIQCKGKDNYLENKLTEKEIDEEIEKALTFEPKLKVYIFTTTAPKDVHIEKYIRLKDQESINKGNFEIILYSWQDIADLIEENRETFNWYVNNIQFKEQFDINVIIDTEQENNIIKPTFLKTIKEYKLRPAPKPTPSSLLFSSYDHIETVKATLASIESMSGIFGPKKINHGWCKFIISISNTGSKVLEDWKFWLEFGDSVKKVDDDFTNDIFLYKDLSKYRTTWAYKEEKQILYRPLNNSPLIQKDSKSFECFCIPNFDSKEITIKWQLLARDFDRDGECKIIVEPEYEIKYDTIFVDSIEDIRTETEISDYITSEKEKNK